VGKVLLLFILVPLVETYLLSLIGGAIGWANTIALVVVTGLLGGWLTKLEWSRAWRAWQSALAQGRMPDDGVLSGVLLIIGGALLITPGVVTDFVGLCLLIPQSRRALANFLRPRLQQRFAPGAQPDGEGGTTVRVIRFGHLSFGDLGFDADAPFERDEVRSFGDDARQPEPIRRRPHAIVDADFEVSEPREPE
jgi:UPF0716 protein FxsA